jgi:transposase
MVPGRDSAGALAWLEGRDVDWRAQVRYGVLDLSGPYRKVFDLALDHVMQVADPFHVVRLANDKLDECRRRVQNQTLGHRGRKDDPLYRVRKLLVMAEQRLEASGSEKMLGLLKAGDPRGEVRTAWFTSYRIRALLYAGKPNWDLLATVTPR